MQEEPDLGTTGVASHCVRAHGLHPELELLQKTKTSCLALSECRLTRIFAAVTVTKGLSRRRVVTALGPGPSAQRTFTYANVR